MLYFVKFDLVYFFRENYIINALKTFLPQQSFLQVSVFTRNVITRRAIVLA
jgi:hypothetical protein